MKKIFFLAFMVAMSAGVYADITVGNFRYSNPDSGGKVTLLGPKSGYTPSGSLSIPATISYQSKSYKVSKIGDKAFLNCTNITTLGFVDTQYLLNVGKLAFKGCTSLTTIAFGGQGNNDLIIDSEAFSGCTKLTTVSFPPQMAYLESYAFYGCTGLKTLTFYTIHAIDPNAFAGCTNLTTVGWGSGYTDLHISTGTYSDGTWIWSTDGSGDIQSQSPFLAIKTTLKSITITGKYVPSYLCYGLTGLETVYFGTNIEKIGNCAFRGCTNLQSVDAFHWSASEYPNLTSIGIQAFSQCPNLFKNGTLLLNCPYLKEIGKEAFSGVTMENLEINCAKLTDIGSKAFSNCTQLYKIRFFGSSISGVRPIRSDVFEGDTKVNKLIIDVTNQQASEVWSSSHYPFSSTYLPNLSQVEINMALIPSQMLSGSNVTNLTIGTRVTRVQENAFLNCSKLTSVIWNAPEATHANKNESPFVASSSKISNISFGSEVKTIPATLCKNMRALTGLLLPASLEKIKTEAFSGCTKLGNIMSLATVPPTLEGGVFADCNKDNDKDGIGLRSINLIVPEASKESYRSAPGWKEFFEGEGIEEVIANEKAKDGKYMIDGQVYILRGEKVYDLQGKEVK